MCWLSSIKEVEMPQLEFLNIGHFNCVHATKALLASILSVFLILGFGLRFGMKYEIHLCCRLYGLSQKNTSS